MPKPITKILVIDNHFLHNFRFENLFPGAELRVISSSLLPNLHESAFLGIDLIILSGGHPTPVESFLKTDPGMQAEVNLIQTTNIPLIGICYGHQLVAKAFGCELIKHEPIQRFVSIKIADPTLYKFEEAVVWENHKYSVSTISQEIESLATYKPLNIHEIIKHKTKNIWGVQFHPERDPKKNDGSEILSNILAKMGLQKIDTSN